MKVIYWCKIPAVGYLLVVFEEHMIQKWFKIVEEDEDKEETLFSWNITMVHLMVWFLE